MLTSRLAAGQSDPIEPQQRLPNGAAPATSDTEADAARQSEAAPDDRLPLPGLYGFDTIVVTARRIRETAFTAPYTAASVSEQEIRERRAYRTLPDSLREIPGVYVQKTSYGQGSPFIRGFTGFRTLLLIDGIRLNNAVFRDGPNQYWSTVDPLTIARLELVKGPTSVLYGSDAIGGTVNAITRRPRVDPDGASADPGLYYRFASAETSNVVRPEGQASYSGRLGALGGVSWKDFGDLRGGSDTGRLFDTGYDELDGDLKAAYLIRPGLELVAAFQRVDQYDIPRTHSTIFSKPFHGTTVGTDLQFDLDQTRTLGYGQLHWHPEPGGWITRGSFSLSYQLQQEQQDRVRDSFTRQKEGFDDGTLGAWFQLDSPSPIGLFTYGVEYYHDFVSSFFEEFDPDGRLVIRRPRGAVANDASYDLLGVYAQTIFDVTDDLEVTLGGRVSWAHAAAEDVDPDPLMPPAIAPISDSYSSAVGSLRGVYWLAQWANVFAGVSQAFRAPNLSDLTRFEMNPASGEFEVPSPDLKPEQYVALETGVKFEWTTAEAFVSYYYTFIDDLIVRVPTGRIVDGGPEFTKTNASDGDVQGVELGAAWNFYWGFSVFGNFAWLEGTVDTQINGEERREWLSRLQPAVGVIGLSWEAPGGRWWAEFDATFAGTQDRLDRRDQADTQRIPPGGTPGYDIYALRGGYRCTDRLSFFASVENLTNANYRIHGSGVNEPGINAIVGLQWGM